MEFAHALVMILIAALKKLCECVWERELVHALGTCSQVNFGYVNSNILSIYVSDTGWSDTNQGSEEKEVPVHVHVFRYHCFTEDWSPSSW